MYRCALLICHNRQYGTHENSISGNIMIKLQQICDQHFLTLILESPQLGSKEMNLKFSCWKFLIKYKL